MSSYGATFWRSIDGIAYHQILGLIDISPPDLSRKTVDDTEPESEYPTKKPGMRKAGDVSLTLKAEENPHISEMIDDYEADSPRFYRIDYGVGFSVGFSGFVISVGDDAPKSSRITRKITISLTGTPTLNNRGN